MTKEVNSLGKAQADVENATRTLKAAQTSLVAANNKFIAAKEAHEKAVLALNSVFNTVRGSSKVPQIGYN